MRIRSIQVERFATHERAKVELPMAGVVVVTGENGAGKSTLFSDSVAWALWGKTLRGVQPPPWPDLGGVNMLNTFAYVTTDEVVAMRNRAKKLDLAWTQNTDTASGASADTVARLTGERKVVYESTRHAQEALDKVIWPFEVWRRACVFSTADAAHFSLATDAERKRLLEEILQLDRFDEALATCRTDLARREESKRAAEAELTRAQSSSGAYKDRLMDARMTLAQLMAAKPEPLDPVSNEDVTAALAAYTAVEEKRRRASRLISTASANPAVMNARAALVDAERVQARHARGVCGACGQDIAEKVQEDARAAVEAARAALEEATRARDVAVEAATAELEAATAEQTRLRNRYEDALRQQRRYQESLTHVEWWMSERVRQEQIITDTEARRDIALATVADLERFIADHVKDIGVLKSVERVLGLRGVRAMLLESSLAAVSALATAAVARLGRPGGVIELRSTTEKKDGGQREAISIHVSGVGAGGEYRALSGGERRRVDLAILIGVAEVAAGARMTAGSTLEFDEVLDGLDETGKEACIAWFEELAADRCVIVITHDKAFAERLPAVKRIHLGGEP